MAAVTGGVSANAPNAEPGQQDFIKGWPHPSYLITPQLKTSLKASFDEAMEASGSILNYGDKDNGAHMLGHPSFRAAMAEFLTKTYPDKPAVAAAQIMSTGGSSMGTDLCARVWTQPGDIAISEEPTYYLAHTMFRDRGLELKGVAIEEDGISVKDVEAVCEANPGKVKILYTIPVHHNPTGITMSNEKRAALVALAQKYDFRIIADEAYQLLSFEDPGAVPLFYHDDPANPKVFSVGTFSKLIGPGVKVGWIQAHEPLLKPMSGIGFIDSGNNPVIMASSLLSGFIKSGALAEHIAYVSREIGAKKDLMVKELQRVGYAPNNPKGGYFCWIPVPEGKKRTGRTGKGMCLDPPEKCENYMRLCFAWLEPEQIIEGIKYLED